MWIRSFAVGIAGAALTFGVLMPNEVRAVAAALVNVTNTTANPVPTRSADIVNAFQTRVFPNPRTSAQFTVPAGKTLVITSVTGFNNGGLGTDLAVGTTANGQAGEIRLPFRRPGTGLWYLDTMPLQLVADAGTTVYFFVNSSSTDFAGYNIDVKGYYLPAP